MKRPRYQRAGAEYWIVDLDPRLLERSRPSDDRPEILTERVEWTVPVAPGALAIDLNELFAEAHGEI